MVESKVENKFVSKVKSYKIAFNSSHGKKVLFDLMRTHHVLTPCFKEQDSHLSAFREGERNVVLRIMTMMGIDPKKLLENVEKESDYE